MSRQAASGRPNHDGKRLPAPSGERGRGVRDAAWVWELNDVRSTPHIFAGGFVMAIADARTGGGDVAARLRRAREFVDTLVEIGRIRAAGERAEPRSGLEKFADAVEAAMEAREGDRLGTRKRAHQQLDRLQVELNDLAVQNDERLRRPRPLQVVAIPGGDGPEARRQADLVAAVSDPAELQAAWRLTAARWRRAAAKQGPASEPVLELTRGLEAVASRLRVLGHEPPPTEKPRGRER